MNQISPGPRNSITDIDGLTVGNASDPVLKSGVTAILTDKPAVCSAKVLGGGPGTRDVALLEPENTVEAIDAIALSGGSAFGLDAAGGVSAYMRQAGRGFQLAGQTIPIVPGAILFDLINGGNKDWDRYPPYREIGFEAAKSASADFETGTAGAGHGALVAGLKGGLGSASTLLPNGIMLGALVAVNSLGAVTISDTPNFHAAPFELGNEFGGLGIPSPYPEDADQLRIKFRDSASPRTNTTIAVIATDAILTKAQAKRLAIAAHDGFTRAIWPSHTPLDGDIVFALATGGSKIEPRENDWIDLGAYAAATMARAIARGVHDATPEANDIYPAWKTGFE